MRVTRRGLQIALGVLWVLDGLLQLQPYMFTKAFAADVLAPSADGQPGFVAAPIHVAVSVVAAHPVLTNTSFALLQMLLGLGLVWRRTARLAIWGTFAWTFAVWWLGEGLGGLLSGHAMLISGAPGAVLLYAVVAAAALGEAGGDGRGEPPRRWIVGAWAVLWIVGGLLQALPGQNSGAAVADALADSAESAPAWLHGVGQTVTASFAQHGWLVLVLIAMQVAVGATALLRPARAASAVAGTVLAAGFWMVGQGMGELTTGTSTDPNSAPLLLLLALAVATHVRPQLASLRSRSSFATCPVALTL